MAHITGIANKVRDFVETAFKAVGLNWQNFVVVDEKLYRPAEDVTLVGDARKANQILNCQPKVQFIELVERMVKADILMLEQGGGCHKFNAAVISAWLVMGRLHANP